MCMILDVNMWHYFLNSKQAPQPAHNKLRVKKTASSRIKESERPFIEAMGPVHNWLNKKKGKLVYSNHESFAELTQNRKQILERYRQSGKALRVFKEQVELAINELRKKHEFKSNDIHILGLARAANVKIICSRDKKLHYDFTKILKGRVYQKASHKRLLTKDTCP